MALGLGTSIPPTRAAGSATPTPRSLPLVWEGSYQPTTAFDREGCGGGSGSGPAEI